MIDWAKKKIYKNCQSIADKLRTSDDERQMAKARGQAVKSQLGSAPDILAGETPWKIIESPLGSHDVWVYRYDAGNWENISKCSKKVIGVEESEFRRIMQEKFGATIYETDYSYYVSFESEEQAKELVKDIAPYYDEYHLPRAMMDRMLCYAEGGYPPYFEKHKKCPNEEQREEYIEKRCADQDRERAYRTMISR